MKNTSDLQRDHFNTIAERYITHRSHENHLAYKEALWSKFLSLINKYSAPKAGTVGLEAMCGNAEISAKLSQHFPGLSMDAFDYSDEMVKSGQEKLGKSVKIFHQDILKLDSKETYDFIILIGGLHHVYHNCSAALDKIYASLKPGGYFFNFEPTHDNFVWKAVRERIYKSNDLFEESTEQGFELKELNSLFKKSGFKIEKQMYPGLLGYILFYNPDAFPALNKGGTALAKIMSKIDLFFSTTFIGKKFSFATWSVVRRPLDASTKNTSE